MSKGPATATASLRSCWCQSISAGSEAGRGNRSAPARRSNRASACSRASSSPVPAPKSSRLPAARSRSSTLRISDLIGSDEMPPDSSDARRRDSARSTRQILHQAQRGLFDLRLRWQETVPRAAASTAPACRALPRTRTGASSDSKASSWMIAARLSPMPPVRESSWTISTRLQWRATASSAARSSGTSERRSSTLASMPRVARSSATRRHVCTYAP